MNVYIVNGDDCYIDMFTRNGWDVVNEIYKADLICFTGGEDVSPGIYGDKAHPYTYSNPFRDEYEAKIFQQYVDVPKVGICRGSQFLNVLSGGRMYQHVSGHGKDHYISTDDGDIVLVSSTHHQMMMPSSDAVVLATSIDVYSKREWYDGEIKREDSTVEGAEVVYYSHTNSLCFQSHPEFLGDQYTGMTDYFFSLVERCLVKQDV